MLPLDSGGCFVDQSTGLHSYPGEVRLRCIPNPIWCWTQLACRGISAADALLSVRGWRAPLGNERSWDRSRSGVEFSRSSTYWGLREVDEDSAVLCTMNMGDCAQHTAPSHDVVEFDVHTHRRRDLAPAAFRGSDGQQASALRNCERIRLARI